MESVNNASSKIIKYPVRSRIAISNEIYYTLARYMLDGSV